MTGDIGFYNKYIFNNNSYLKSHLVRDVVKKHNNNKELNIKIDENLEVNYYNCPLKNNFYRYKTGPFYLKKNIKKVRFFIDNDKTDKNIYFPNINNKLPLINSKCDRSINTDSSELNDKLPLLNPKCDMSINTDPLEFNDKSTNTKTDLDFLKRNKLHDQKSKLKKDNLNTNNASICKRINIYNENII